MAQSITLQNVADADIVNNDILGQICFAAPNEAGGTDSILIAASMFARSEGTFAADNNATELVFTTGASESAAPGATNYDMTLSSAGNLTLVGDLTISGDDLTMATNTSGAALIADGTNFNPVVISGDIAIGTDGAATIQANSVDGTMIALGSDTTGDIMYYNGTNYVRLAAAQDGYILTATGAGAAPAWEAAGGGSGDITGVTLAGDSGTAEDLTANVNLTVAGGNGITTSGSSATMTVALDAALTTVTSLLATDIKIGEDNETKVDFETANQINFYADNTKRVTIDSTGLTVDSGSLETATIDYTDGDLAVTIADGGAVTFAKSINQAANAVTDGGAVDINCGLSNYHEVLMNATATSVVFTNATAGQRIVVRFKQHSSHIDLDSNDGWDTVTVNGSSATVTWPGGTIPTLTETNNAIDVYGFIFQSTVTNVHAFIIGQALA